MKHHNQSALSPWAILGLQEGRLDGEQIRARYLDKIKEFPPEKDPIRFEQVRDAYLELHRQCQAGGSVPLEVDPCPALESLLPSSRQTRNFVGPQAWLAVLKG